MSLGIQSLGQSRANWLSMTGMIVRIFRQLQRKPPPVLLAFVLLASMGLRVARVSTEEARQSLSAKHMLWVVQTATKRLYLLGAFHLLQPQDYPLPHAFE